jgi:hypothetical protein
MHPLACLPRLGQWYRCFIYLATRHFMQTSLSAQGHHRQVGVVWSFGTFATFWPSWKNKTSLPQLSGAERRSHLSPKQFIDSNAMSEASYLCELVAPNERLSRPIWRSRLGRALSGRSQACSWPGLRKLQSILRHVRRMPDRNVSLHRCLGKQRLPALLNLEASNTCAAVPAPYPQASAKSASRWTLPRAPERACLPTGVVERSPCLGPSGKGNRPWRASHDYAK